MDFNHFKPVYRVQCFTIDFKHFVCVCEFHEYVHKYNVGECGFHPGTQRRTNAVTPNNHKNLVCAQLCVVVFSCGKEALMVRPYSQWIIGSHLSMVKQGGPKHDVTSGHELLGSYVKFVGCSFSSLQLLGCAYRL